MSLVFPRLVSDTKSSPVQRGSAFFLVAVLHAGALAALTNWAPATGVSTQTRPMHVRLVDSPPPSPPPSPKKKPMPKPVRRPPPVPQEHVLAVETPLPAAERAAFMVPPPPPPAAPAVEVAVTKPPAPSVAEAPAPPVFEPPRFSAAYLDNPKPVYPPASRRLGEEGKVVLRVHVLPDGRPEIVEVKTSSGFSRLDEAARTAVAKWRFIPARRGEEAVAAWVVVPIVFSLDG